MVAAARQVGLILWLLNGNERLMHEFCHHLNRMLADRLKNAGIVTWYDPRCQFMGYVSELIGADLPADCALQEVSLGRSSTQLCVVQDSFLEVRDAIQPVVTGELPGPLLIYIPNKEQYDDKGNLMELEAGGNRWEPQLERIARAVLKRRFSEEEIVNVLGAPGLNYTDIVRALAN